MNFKNLSRYVMHLGILALAVGLAACGPEQTSTQHEPVKDDTPVAAPALPKNVIEPVDTVDNSLGKDKDGLCHFQGQACSLVYEYAGQTLSQVAIHEDLICVPLKDGEPNGVCQKLCGKDYFECVGTDICRQYTSPSKQIEDVGKRYTGYCVDRETLKQEAAASNKEICFSRTDDCGENKRCVENSSTETGFSCKAATGTKKADGAQCSSDTECHPNSYCVPTFDSQGELVTSFKICAKRCNHENRELRNDKGKIDPIDIGKGRGECSEQDQKHKKCDWRDNNEFECEETQYCLGNSEASIVAPGVSVCYDKKYHKVCDPSQSTACDYNGNGQEDGLCISRGVVGLCVERGSDDPVGSKKMFEQCDDANGCEKGLSCQEIDRSDVKYCVKPCDPTKNVEEVCPKATGKGAKYYCEDGINKNSELINSRGYCLLQCDGKDLHTKCNENGDSTLSDDVYCVDASTHGERYVRESQGSVIISFFSRGSAAVCLERGGKHDVTSGKTCALEDNDCAPVGNHCGLNSVCEGGYYCNPDAEEGKTGCASGKTCVRGEYRKDSNLGICRKFCEPESEGSTRSSDCGPSELCYGVHFEPLSEQPYRRYCITGGNVEEGDECSVTRLRGNIIEDSLGTSMSCKPGLACITSSDLNLTSLNNDTIQTGTCGHTCQLFDSKGTSTCPSGSKCGYSKFLNEFTGFPQEVGMCFETGSNPSDAERAESCKVVGAPCAEGTVCSDQIFRGKNVCVKLCRPSHGHEDCQSTGGFCYSRYGQGLFNRDLSLCINFRL